MDNTEQVHMLRITEEGKSDTEDIVIIEFPLTIILNNQELVTLLCSPINLDYLAIGFLFSEGLVKGKDAIKKILVDEQRGVVRVETDEDNEFARELLFKRLITSGCGKGTSFYSAASIKSQPKVESQIVVSPHEVFVLVNEFQHRSQLFRATGGVHSAALSDTKNILIFNEDIGRHNAIDRIFGECILKELPIDNHMIITSGRISSEILLKAAKGQIPIIISKTAPTNLGVRLAADLGITIIGFVRGKRMNVYTHGWRVAA